MAGSGPVNSSTSSVDIRATARAQPSGSPSADRSGPAASGDSGISWIMIPPDWQARPLPLAFQPEAIISFVGICSDLRKYSSAKSASELPMAGVIPLKGSRPSPRSIRIAR